MIVMLEILACPKRRLFANPFPLFCEKTLFVVAENEHGGFAILRIALV